MPPKDKKEKKVERNNKQYKKDKNHKKGAMAEKRAGAETSAEQSAGKHARLEPVNADFFSVEEKDAIQKKQESNDELHQAMFRRGSDDWQTPWARSLAQSPGAIMRVVLSRVIDALSKAHGSPIENAKPLSMADQDSGWAIAWATEACLRSYADPISAKVHTSVNLFAIDLLHVSAGHDPDIGVVVEQQAFCFSEPTDLAMTYDCVFKVSDPEEVYAKL